MRHEVARICASGLADNLHFESISFTWWCVYYHLWLCICSRYICQ